jgi:hypothetical protein
MHAALQYPDALLTSSSHCVHYHAIMDIVSGGPV